MSPPSWQTEDRRAGFDEETSHGWDEEISRYGEDNRRVLPNYDILSSTLVGGSKIVEYF